MAFKAKTSSFGTSFLKSTDAQWEISVIAKDGLFDTRTNERLNSASNEETPLVQTQEAFNKPTRSKEGLIRKLPNESFKLEPNDEAFLPDARRASKSLSIQKQTTYSKEYTEEFPSSPDESGVLHVKIPEPRAKSNSVGDWEMESIAATSTGYGWYDSRRGSLDFSRRGTTELEPLNARSQGIIQPEKWCCMCRTDSPKEIMKITIEHHNVNIKHFPGKSSGLMFAWAITAFKIVQIANNKHAEFEIIAQKANILVSRWKRHSDFQALARFAKKQGYPSCKAPWVALKKRMPWYRCLDVHFLQLKALYLGIFLQSFLFDCDDIDIIMDFLDGVLTSFT